MKDKVALITGASRGIGKSIALALAKEGYNLILNYRKSKLLAENLAREIEKDYKVKVLTFCADIGNFTDCQKLCEFCFNNYKNIDVLINNAGICIDTELCDRTVGNFIETFNINVFGPFLITKIIGEQMVRNKYGKIVNISSNNSINKFYPTSIDYDASKCALNSLTKNFAIEFAPYVNVNAVAPGWVETGMNKYLSFEFMESEKEKILKKRIGKPEDVANLVSFLVSDKADYINGQIIAIDGGAF